MAYLHCHTRYQSLTGRGKDCGWSQDDFWEWKGIFTFWRWKHRPFGYNPFSLILADIAENWWPQFKEFDWYAAKEMGFKTKRVHSWVFLCYNVKRYFRRLFTMKWWTYESWKKDYDSGLAVCPRCKKRNFDID
jgi:hypothetical protein